MAIPAATERLLLKRMFFHCPFVKPPPRAILRRFDVLFSTTNTLKNSLKSTAGKQKQKKGGFLDSNLKKRTRSDREIDEESFLKHYGNGNCAHVPVLLGEVLDVFSSVSLSSFVDCTLGAAGHSSAIIKAHPEMKLFVGMDVDPVASEMSQRRIKGLLDGNVSASTTGLQVHTFVRNFRHIKSVLSSVDGQLVASGVNGILMDLGMSSMQVNNAARGFSVLGNGPLDMRMNPEASLKAEDILNSWPEDEVGKVIRDYGEESNWYHLQNKIVKARQHGGLHSTNDLVDLIRGSTSWARGGRQGWIKTATRVFQALRIAVNDELNTLRDAINACFDCLSPGGRLAVISFHSLEDRIVKQAFLNLVNNSNGGGGSGGDDKKTAEIRSSSSSSSILLNSDCEKEEWIKQIVQGQKGTILTKRPISPSVKEEALNPRSRSAKLRVIEKN